MEGAKVGKIEITEDGGQCGVWTEGSDQDSEPTLTFDIGDKLNIYPENKQEQE